MMNVRFKSWLDSHCFPASGILNSSAIPELMKDSKRQAAAAVPPGVPSRKIFMGSAWLLACLQVVGAAPLEDEFREPPNPAKPGVYWYFMDGNIDRKELIRDLDSMKEAGLGHVLWLEVNVDVPRGPVTMLSEEWMKSFEAGVKHAAKLGIDVTLGTGPGWTGSGGPWIKPEESMQHLVFSECEVRGPARIEQKLTIAPQRDHWWKMLDCDFYEDVAVYAVPAVKPVIANAGEKAFYSRADYMHDGPTFLPAPAVHDEAAPEDIIAPEGIIDLTKFLKPGGTLVWDAPAGKWTVLRFGRRSNGTSNLPAAKPMVGLDHDKFSKQALEKHFDQFCAKLIDRAGPVGSEGKGGLVALHLDSWEMNAQNWSPTLLDEFKRRRGYDFTPWLPTFSGRVVRDRASSERALWDLRLTIQELMLENYVGHFRDLAKQRGLKFSIEHYGGTQIADLELGAFADVPMCEFWSTKYDCSHSAFEAASVAHTLGRPVVSSEAFTGHRDEKGRHYPGSLKNQADWAFAAGVNHIKFHTFVHQALGDDALPGMTMGDWGMRWHRGQTWWPMVGAFHRYLARCSHLLQQGTAVSDVLYLTAEGAPHVFIAPPSALAGAGVLPDKKGYSFDGGAPSVLQQMKVVDGCIGVPGATQYRLLVLPRFETMTPEFLGRIIELVESGATVLGYPPGASPSLVNFPQCDAKVKQLAQTLWGAPPYAAERKVGKGRIILDAGAAEFLQRRPAPTTVKNKESVYPDYAVTARLLEAMKVPEDFRADQPLRHAHRNAAQRDIYFVSNPVDTRVEATATFRVPLGRPQLWNPATGEIRHLPEFKHEGQCTSVPLTFEANESYFIVFAREASAVPAGKGGNFPRLEARSTLEGPWEVSFDPKWGPFDSAQGRRPGEFLFESLQDWTAHPTPGIKYYSGIATYRKTFPFAGETAGAGQRHYLDLGTVHDIARVRLNGKDLGVLWAAPWRVEISSALRQGENRLEIEVANRWSNRLLGDQQEPDKNVRVLKWESGLLEGKEFPAGRYTFSTSRGLGELLPSGLLGPVRLMK